MLAPLGVLIAGGRGRRLGNPGPKAHALLGGQTLLERAMATLTPVCGEVVIALSDGVEPPATLGRGVFVALDRPGTRGPLAGLVAGLEARPFEVALVLGVDFPLARSAALRFLATRLGSRLAVVPEPGGRAQPLFAVYAAGARAPLTQALERGEQALVPAVMALDPVRVADQELATLDGGLENFLNVNRPDELAEAQRRLRSSPAAGGR
ncbi:MAG: molybdenum cofactor guanylyltransferase [Candidatus Eiseniibacteriota bacterium]